MQSSLDEDIVRISSGEKATQEQWCAQQRKTAMEDARRPVPETSERDVLQRIASAASIDGGAGITIVVDTDTETREVLIRPKQSIHNALAAAFGRLPEALEEVFLGDDAVLPDESFEQWGIEDAILALMLSHS